MTMTMKAPDFFESLAMADCLARQFVNAYPSKEPNPKWRGFLQQWVIPGMRWLWRNGNTDTRTSIAARIAVWRGLDEQKVRDILRRVQLREEIRNATKGGK